MQAVLPQSSEAFQAYLDNNVQEATQEGHPCRSCEEEALYSQETILQINCWCYFGSHSEEEIQKKRTEKAEVRDAAREATLREIKERIKKTKDEKKAKKAELMARTRKTQTKGSMPKAAKGPKIGGGGRKR
ncbi:hypothetical protein AAC387_Pa03g3177 [Persea americana]